MFLYSIGVILFNASCGLYVLNISNHYSVICLIYSRFLNKYKSNVPHSICSVKSFSITVLLRVAEFNVSIIVPYDIALLMNLLTVNFTPLLTRYF